MTVRFRDEALEDLEQIASYISRDNPAAAESVVARIHDVIYDTLDLLPHSGHASRCAHEFAVPHLPYIIVYTPDEHDVSTSSASSTPRCIRTPDASSALKARARH